LVLRSISRYIAGKSYLDKGLVGERSSGVLVDIDMPFRIIFTTKDSKITKGFFAYFAFFAVNIFLFPTSSTHAVDNVRVATASLTSPSVLYLLVAQKEGYFKNEGLNVEILNIRGELAAKITAVGEIDFFTQGFSGLGAAVRGIPLKILMVADEKPDWDFMAQPQIKSFAQLKGSAVGILSIGGTVAVVTREILRRNNLDPAKDVNLMVMGGNDMRFISLKGKVIQATLLDAANSYRAQKEGFTKLAAAGDYVSEYFSGGIVTSIERIKQSPDKVARFMTAALKGYLFFATRREASINYMMQFFKSKDRDAISAIYDASVKVMTRDGTVEEKVLQAVVDDAQRAAGVKKEIRTVDYFDFSFLRKAREQLKASGWRP
jgi:NitT/TauT family transport system substrate-binding protein